MAGLFLFMGAACGLKAAPKPREVVVPTAVNDLKVRIVPAGIEVAFTLPSKSLDGSRLRELGGYRITRRGEKTAETRKEVRFSISERRREVGKSVVFIDKPPVMAGSYYYHVTPFDIYGSHDRSYPDAAGVLLLWKGLPPGEKEGEKQLPYKEKERPSG